MTILKIIDDFLAFLASNPVYIFGIPLAAIFITYSLKGVQFRYFKAGIGKLLNNGGSQDEGISSFKAAALAIGGRVGTGNVAGVTFAILAGGPGAIFWMWVVALFSMGTSFAESTLGQLFKEKNEDHVYVGGPAYYLNKGLFKKDSKYKRVGSFLAIVFSIIMIVSFGLFFISLQTSTILTTTYSAFNLELTSVVGIIIFIIIMALTGYAAFGGARKLTDLSAFIVPVMTVGYALLVVVIIFLNFTLIPQFFQLVITEAFSPNALIGGGIFVVISNGVKRGIFSNEAGQGSGAIASGSAQVDHPVEQGIAQMVTVFIDTIVVCTLTGFVVITAWYKQGFLTGGITEGDYNELLNNGSSAEMAANAFGFSIPFGAELLAIFLFFFAFSSILAEIFYATQSVKYLFRNNMKTKHIVLKLYGVMTIVMVAVTPLLLELQSLDDSFNLFDTADNLASLLFYTNVIALLFLVPTLKKLLNDYESKIKTGKDMSFKSSDIDIDIDNCAWD